MIQYFVAVVEVVVVVGIPVDFGTIVPLQGLYMRVLLILTHSHPLEVRLVV
jgi:hypothetical protein